MCYNIAFMEKRAQKYAERYKDVIPTGWNPDVLPDELPQYFFVSGFTHPLLPIVRHDGICMAQWGLIPYWVKNAENAREIQSKTLNAMGETVFEKPSFRKSIASQRCILGVSGFYEWRTFQNKKYPYLIRASEQALFSLACIFDTWCDQSTGEISTTFSILTTPANTLLEKIHNIKKRMPLILGREDEGSWLDPQLKPEAIRQLIKPFGNQGLLAHTISNEANKASTNRNKADIMRPIVYPELTD